MILLLTFFFVSQHNRFDNSEFMRNGDYIPTRLGAEVETVGMIAQAKCDANPENTVAIVASSGRPNVVLTLTSDVARVFTNTDKIPIVGTIDFINSFHVATVCYFFLFLLFISVVFMYVFFVVTASVESSCKQDPSSAYYCFNWLTDSSAWRF